MLQHHLIQQILQNNRLHGGLLDAWVQIKKIPTSNNLIWMSSKKTL